MNPSTSSPEAGPPGSRLVIPIVVGTRPEAIKLIPVIMALQQSPFYRPIVVSTGQHHRMVSYIFELAGITPDVMLWSGSLRAQLNTRVGSVLERFEDYCVDNFELEPGMAPPWNKIVEGRAPAVVLVHGDTSSAMAAALSAFHMRIPVLHLEAGLRAGSNLSPFPEELNRGVITRVAALHLAPTAKNLENLVKEGVPASQVFVTGNTGIDALRWAANLDVRFANPELQRLYDSDRRIVVATAHRRENWGAGLIGIAEGISRLAARFPDVSFVLPVHPNPAVREVLVQHLAGHDNVLTTDTLGYATFSKLLARAHVVITDSGGVQEEAPSLEKPVLVLRDTTERAEGVVAGTLRLVGTDPSRIELEGSRLLDDEIAYTEMAHARNPYGDGRAASRIVTALEHILLGGDPPEPFGPGYDRETILRATGFRLDDHQIVEPAAPLLATTRSDPVAADTAPRWPVTDGGDHPTEQASPGGPAAADR